MRYACFSNGSLVTDCYLALEGRRLNYPHFRVLSVASVPPW